MHRSAPTAIGAATWQPAGVTAGGQVVYVGADAPRRGLLDELLADTRLASGPPLEHPAEAILAPGGPPSVAVLDAAALGTDAAVAGIGLLGAAWPDAAIVVVHDDTGPAVVRSLLDAGATSIVTSATPPGRLRATLEASADGHGLIDVDVVRPVIDLYATMHAESRRRSRAVIESLAAAVEAKDSVTSRHLHAVSRLATQVAWLISRELALSEDFLFGCLLHDVGKIGVPERILAKPAALTDEEWRVMRRHPQTGANVVRPLGLAPVVTEMVLYHHERWDGRGYPEGLRDDEIPLAARIFSVCDALEAMTAHRPYRRALPVPVAFERVRIEAGTQFDPAVVEALERGVRTGDVVIDGDEGLGGDEPPRRRFTPGPRP